ncbi:hypothetical protein Patl1_25397 [Pistacia atlantica]|uniref:Uncharacterized protein n=1 Tax=Pistacia atlantica TaxID=434234 RepID=A0ACC1B2S1_9ROSI|nr:hypothetical protein Patl1_25397 [Pistacia atlantica]
MLVVPNQAFSNWDHPTSDPTTRLDNGCPMAFGSFGHTFPGIGPNVDEQVLPPETRHFCEELSKSLIPSDTIITLDILSTQAMLKLVVGLLLKRTKEYHCFEDDTYLKALNDAVRVISTRNPGMDFSYIVETVNLKPDPSTQSEPNDFIPFVA